MGGDSPLGPAPITIASRGAAAICLLVSHRNDAGAAGLLVLTVAVRARTGGHLSRRVPGRRAAIPAAARRAGAAARRTLHQGSAVSRFPKHLLLVPQRSRVPGV